MSELIDSKSIFNIRLNNKELELYKVYEDNESWDRFNQMFVIDFKEYNNLNKVICFKVLFSDYDMLITNSEYGNTFDLDEFEQCCNEYIKEILNILKENDLNDFIYYIEKHLNDLYEECVLEIFDIDLSEPRTIGKSEECFGKEDYVKYVVENNYDLVYSIMNDDKTKKINKQ